jgi:hypothetical protein
MLASRRMMIFDRWSVAAGALIAGLAALAVSGELRAPTPTTAAEMGEMGTGTAITGSAGENDHYLELFANGPGRGQYSLPNARRDEH